MLSYYTANNILCWIALGTLCILVRENGRLHPEDKRLLYLTYLLIGLSALAEWCGVQLNGRADLPSWMIKLAKCADYILSPMAGGALVLQMKLRNRWRDLMLGILAGNAVLQGISFFTGWMITVDAENHYTHGPLYLIYMAVCMAVIVLLIVEFILYGRAFRHQNRISLYAIMVIVALGVALQELLPSAPRTIYIALSLGAALMFIHYMEFFAIAIDDHVSAQQVQLETDILTGALNRYAYTNALLEYADGKLVPQDLVVFTVDINGLKQANDSLGHEAGDELIRGAAQCIKDTLGQHGDCYRTGGDEFVVLARMNAAKAAAMAERLESETKRWHGELVGQLSLSMGCALALEHPGLSAEKLAHEADLAMYAAKAAYYRNSGIDRRRSR